MGYYSNYYEKSFTAVMESPSSYKLTIDQNGTYECDYLVWGEWKSRIETASKITNLVFGSKEEVYKAILDNLIEYDNLHYKFRFRGSGLNELINTDLNPITLYLKTGFAYVDRDGDYIKSSEKNNKVVYERGGWKSRRYASARCINRHDEIKKEEYVSLIKLGLNPLNTYLRDKNIDENDFNNYVKEYIKNLKGVSVEVDLPILSYYPELDNIDYFSEDYYLNIKCMLKDLRNKKFILDMKQYNNMFYAIDNLDINHFNRPKDIKPLINNSNTIVFKYKLKNYYETETSVLNKDGIRTLALKKENYNSKYDFTSNVKDLMYELIDIYLKDKRSPHDNLKLTTFELKKEKTLVICLYDISDDSIKKCRKHIKCIDVKEYEDIVRDNIKEYHIKIGKDKQEQLEIDRIRDLYKNIDM